MSAELAARRTAPAAVVADFHRDADAFIRDDSLALPTPDYCGWAFRLASELQSVLEQLQHEKPDPAAGQLERVRLVLDHFDWESDRQHALDQIDDILRGDR